MHLIPFRLFVRGENASFGSSFLPPFPFIQSDWEPSFASLDGGCCCGSLLVFFVMGCNMPTLHICVCYFVLVSIVIYVHWSVHIVIYAFSQYPLLERRNRTLISQGTKTSHFPLRTAIKTQLISISNHLPSFF